VTEATRSVSTVFETYGTSEDLFRVYSIVGLSSTLLIMSFIWDWGHISDTVCYGTEPGESTDPRLDPEEPINTHVEVLDGNITCVHKAHKIFTANRDITSSEET